MNVTILYLYNITNFLKTKKRMYIGNLVKFFLIKFFACIVSRFRAILFPYFSSSEFVFLCDINQKEINGQEMNVT
jgi:hypothetical protein